MRKAFFLAFSLASMIFAQGAMAADYVTENITPEGRYQNQRVEIELVYVPMF